MFTLVSLSFTLPLFCALYYASAGQSLSPAWFQHCAMTIGYHMFTMASLWYLASFVVQSVFKYVMPKIDPKGQSLLVTGCDTGFGNMAAKSLALKGFHVFACCLFPDREGGQELATIKNITVLSLDVTKPDSISESFKTVKSSLEQSGNSLRALVNNAGIASATFLEWDTMENFHQVYKVNVEGYLRMMREFAPLLRPNEGRIVNIGSFGSRIGVPFMGAYNSSKAAVRIMTDCFRAELSIFGIKVILVEPAVFKTGITNYGTMVSMMNGSWDRSEQHVKDSYGKPLIDFVSLLLNQCDFFADYIDLGRSGSCNKVIDCIEEGIMSYEPQSLYSPAPFFAKIASKTIFVLPHEFLDAIGYLYASYALYGGLVYDKLLRATNIKS